MKTTAWIEIPDQENEDPSTTVRKAEIVLRRALERRYDEVDITMEIDE